MDNNDTQTISEQQDQQAPAWADVDVVTVPEAEAERPGTEEGKSTAPGAPVDGVVEDSKGRPNFRRAGQVADIVLADRRLREVEAERLRAWGGWAAKGFNVDVAERILLGVADGESLTNLAKQEGLPSRSTVWLWRRDCPPFDAAYRVAQEMAGDSIVDDMITLERAVLDGTIHNRAARVVLESHRWRASKMNARYGDNKRIEVDMESRFMRVTLDGSVRMQQDGQLQSLARDMADRAARLLPDPTGK